uniref:Uncharacterized protein n=1 Tax=Fagus sylvatica TaxID=28930 RepID=A0A2N9GES8_FAGSY
MWVSGSRRALQQPRGSPFRIEWPSFAMEPIRLPTGCSGGILSPFHLLNF